MYSVIVPDCKEDVDDDWRRAHPEPQWRLAISEHHGWIVHGVMDVPVHVENQNQEASNRSVSAKQE